MHSFPAVIAENAGLDDLHAVKLLDQRGFLAIRATLEWAEIPRKCGSCEPSGSLVPIINHFESKSVNNLQGLTGLKKNRNFRSITLSPNIVPPEKNSTQVICE